MDCRSLLEQVPSQPGVYMLIDSLGNIIYVGKGKNLRNRLSYYFKRQKNRPPKVEEMIRHIADFQYRVTDTELEAFLEENRLIKEIKPKYNSLLKNSAKYLYLKIPKESFPKLAIVKERGVDQAIYFGPFNSRHKVEAAVNYLHDFYPLRQCLGSRLEKRASKCLSGQIGSCPGVCTGEVSEENYQFALEQIQKLLNGKNMAPVRELSQKIQVALQNLEFEKAAKYREYYTGLTHIINKQRVVLSSCKGQNIAAVEFINPHQAKLYLIKGNKLIHKERLDLNGERRALCLYLQELFRGKYQTEKPKQEGLSQEDLDEAQIIYSYLQRSEFLTSIKIPKSYLTKEVAKLEMLTEKIVDSIQRIATSTENF